jgi:hypothetical protein
VRLVARAAWTPRRIDRLRRADVSDQFRLRCSTARNHSNRLLERQLKRIALNPELLNGYCDRRCNWATAPIEESKNVLLI